MTRLLALLALILALAVPAGAQQSTGFVNLLTSQVSVSAASGTLLAPSRARNSVTIENTTTTAIYIGQSASVTTGTGALLPGTVGASITLNGYNGPVYAISSSGSQTVAVVESY